MNILFVPDCAGDGTVCWFMTSQSLAWKKLCAAPSCSQGECLVQHLWNVFPDLFRTGSLREACPIISRTTEHLQASHYAVQILGLGVSEMHSWILRSSVTYGLYKLLNLGLITSETWFPSLLDGIIMPGLWSYDQDQQECLLFIYDLHNSWNQEGTKKILAFTIILTIISILTYKINLPTLQNCCDN